MPFRAIIKNGQITFPSVRASIAWEGWRGTHEGGEVLISEVKHGRSLSQNAYYWVYLEVIERETGQPATEVHEWAKRKFLPPRFITVNGEELRIPGSTRTLDKLAFGEYLDKIAATVEIALPDPQEAGYLPN